MKRLSGSISLSAVTTVLIAGLLVACAPGPTTPSTPARPTEWNIVTAEQTGGGDPLTEYGTNNEWGLMRHVVEPLLRAELLPDGKSWGLVNYLADKWSFPDNKTLLVELKKGVRFHNGEELTSEHVKYAFDGIVNVDKPGRKGQSLKPLGKAEIVDTYTIKWTMPEPNASVIGVVPLMNIPALARKNMTAAEFERKPIGTGPYKAVEWQRDGTVRLEAWDGYRGGKPFPERLVIRHVPEPSTRVMELQAGSAQIVQTVPIESLASIEGDSKLEVVSLKGSSAIAYVINIFKTTPPLRDKRVRQAMNHAVDREAIVKSILGGRGTTLPGPLWPGYLGYADDVKPYAYDPEKAKTLLKEAGFPDGFSFNWTVTQGVFPKDIEIAQAVANQLAKVGITTTLQPRERARILTERNEGEYDVTELVFPMYWSPATPFRSTLDLAYPDAKLTPKFGATPPELLEARTIVKEANAATSLEQMAISYAKVNKLMHDGAFWLYVHTLDEISGAQKDIAWRPYPADYPTWYDHWALVGKKAPTSPTSPLLPQ